VGEKGVSKTARASMEAGQAAQPKAKVVRTPEETIANIRSLRAGSLYVPGDQIDVLLGEFDKTAAKLKSLNEQAIAIIAADTQRLHNLQAAVKALYTAAHWSADRPVRDAHLLWEAVRDAAGIEPGHAPAPYAPKDMEHFAESIDHDPEHHEVGGEGYLEGL
jgi:hypothetical protein